MKSNDIHRPGQQTIFWQRLIRCIGSPHYIQGLLLESLFFSCCSWSWWKFFDHSPPFLLLIIQAAGALKHELSVG